MTTRRAALVAVLVASPVILSPVVGRAGEDAENEVKTESVEIPQSEDLPETTEDADEDEDEAPNDPGGYIPPPDEGHEALRLNGYIDIGFVHAQGDGTSFAPGDTRFPLDYTADPFATAVNSRGDVASTRTGGRFVNGFLPRSVGAGGQPSFVVNTVDVDVLYDVPRAPVLLFTRLQFLPRFADGGDDTRVVVEQAFGRVSPLTDHELTLSVGKFDPVFGIEYLENPAPLRTGITPSLIARYTTGTVLGAKVFYRLHLAPLWSAVSLNVAATNSAPMVDSLQGPDVSLTGVPVGSARLGYELNLPLVQVKLGGSALYGPRNDQRDSETLQRAFGADARVVVAGFHLHFEFIDLTQDGGPAAGKQTGLGTFPLASAFEVRGFYAEAGYVQHLPWDALRAAGVYARYGQRRAAFEGFTPLEVWRVTAGLRLDLWESLIFKFEYLVNGERAGAPKVDNDVQTASVVFTW
jgi:hypothetical protein